jgi:hypothetical protein
MNIKITGAAITEETSIRGSKAFLFGWLLPSLIFIAGVVGVVWLGSLVHTARTYAPFSIVVYLPFMIPIAVIANTWVFLRKWRTAIELLLAALALPAIFLVGLGVIIFLG